MNLQEGDAAAAAVSTAPRVALADIEAAIGGTFEFTADLAIASMGMPAMAPLGLLSVCILVLRNGFTVIGKSAPVSPQNFSRDLGKKLAYEDAIRQLWPLMGFALKDRMSRENHGASGVAGLPSPGSSI